MANLLRFLSRLTLFACLILGLPAPASAAMVRVLTVQGAISPASADYLLRGIDKAIEDKAHLVVIEMDTPGGLDTAMRDIIKAILASPAPVATYVSPKGARAKESGRERAGGHPPPGGGAGGGPGGRVKRPRGGGGPGEPMKVKIAPVRIRRESRMSIMMA